MYLRKTQISLGGNIEIKTLAWGGGLQFSVQQNQHTVNVIPGHE